MILTVGSRSSRLARSQVKSVVELLEDQTDVRAEVMTMDSTGDRNPDQDPEELDEIGIFTSQLDRNLLDGTYDLVVHSLKDCPTDRNENLDLAAIPPRATPFDVLVGIRNDRLEELENGTVVGTSSQRRRANLLYHNSDVTVDSCRGNVPTRLRKLEDDETNFDALILAAAGLYRLELTPDSRILSQNEMLPSPGQGALAVMCRSDRPEVLKRLRKINHEPSERICRAERSFLGRLEGGCEAPIGGLARTKNGELTLEGSVTAPDGSRRIERTITGPIQEAAELGYRLADRFIEAGANELIAR